jgi:dTDP-4-amino-4,6-dideoxygalactose transaminase
MYIIGEEEIEAVRRVLTSGQLFRHGAPGQATETDKFEQEWARLIGTRHALAVTSGTAALICALVGIGVGPGDEVILPGYTYMATALAPLALGAVPVLAEIDETLTLSAADVEQKITPHTKAIIPVHMAGLPCNMDALLEVAERHSLKIIEDACQADGGSYKGQRHGTRTAAAAYSFNYFKVITCGEGGALVTNHDEVYHPAQIMADGGLAFWRPDEDLGCPLFAGNNYRVSEIQSALLRVQMRRLDGLLLGLRRDKQNLRRALSGQTGYWFNPVNDPEGDCGTVLGVIFTTEEKMRQFLDHAVAWKLPVWSPIDSGRHVYSNWECVMQMRGASHPGRDAFQLTDTPPTMSPDMCPKTLSLLARTLFVNTSPNRSDQEFANLASALLQIARSLPR